MYIRYLQEMDTPSLGDLEAPLPPTQSKSGCCEVVTGIPNRVIT